MLKVYLESINTLSSKQLSFFEKFYIEVNVAAAYFNKYSIFYSLPCDVSTFAIELDDLVDGIKARTTSTYNNEIYFN